jgi:5-methylcytosine-specific restriction endonuclease McrA
MNGEQASSRPPIPPEVVREVIERDGLRCVECGSTDDLQIDHILPVALGGASSVENLQVLCGDCNRANGDSL